MSIHLPKRITSSGGLGLNTRKSIEWLGADCAVTMEIWPKPSAPWRESGTVIADEGYIWKTEWRAGERFVRTDIYDAQKKFIATYIDICRPVTLAGGVFSFDDMYLDIWQPAAEKAALLDADELAMAVEQGAISPEEAEEAAAVAKRLLQEN
jgi:predicted RNA-binding protein associated with RNAse of E/G family